MNTSKVSPPLPVRVLVISSVRLYRDGLADLLRRHDCVQLVAAAASPRDLSRGKGLESDAILIDASADAAPAQVRQLRDWLPGARIVAIALNRDDEAVIECVAAGVDGLVAADADVEDLVQVLRAVSAGEETCSASIAGALLRHVRGTTDRSPRDVGLTRREAEIVALIDHGLSNKQIARRLEVRVPTVKNHVHSILQKLGVSDRDAAARRFRSGSGSGI